MIHSKSTPQEPNKTTLSQQFVQAHYPDIDPQAIQLMSDLRIVSHALYQVGERSVNTIGLSFAQYRVLMSLYTCEKMSDRHELNPSEISDRQGTSRNTISTLIRGLEDQGFVERHLDNIDRRKFNIRLTESGRALVSAHFSEHLRTIANCFDTLTHDEQNTLSHLLNKISVQAGK